MRKKPYPKLTHQNAEIAARLYIQLMKEDCPVIRTTDITDHSRTKIYKETIQALHRLVDNGILDYRSVGDAGNVWWCKERLA